MQLRALISDNKVEFETATRARSPALPNCPPHNGNEGHTKRSNKGEQDENIAIVVIGLEAEKQVHDQLCRYVDGYPLQ